MYLIVAKGVFKIVTFGNTQIPSKIKAHLSLSTVWMLYDDASLFNLRVRVKINFPSIITSHKQSVMAAGQEHFLNVNDF